MEKGTYEWQVAVNKLNSSLRGIIDSFNLIYGSDYGIDEDGLYYLTPEGKKNAAEKAKQARIDTQIAANASSLAEDKTTKDKLVVDKKREYSRAVANFFTTLDPNFGEGKDSAYDQAFNNLTKAFVSKDYVNAEQIINTLAEEITDGAKQEQIKPYLLQVQQLLGEIAENTAVVGVDGYLDMASNIVAGNENLTTEDTTAIAYAIKELVEQNADKK